MNRTTRGVRPPTYGEGRSGEQRARSLSTCGRASPRCQKGEGEAGAGIGFLGLLCIAFIVLKLTGVIDWSWWWVMAPIWIPWSILLVGVVVFFIASGIILWLQQRREAKYLAEKEAEAEGEIEHLKEVK